MDREFHGKRLPREIEWRWASRGGALAYKYPGTNHKLQAADDRYGELRDVGSYAPTPSGLHDMAGDVWEHVACMTAEPRCSARGGSFATFAEEELRTAFAGREHAREAARRGGRAPLRRRDRKLLARHEARARVRAGEEARAVRAEEAKLAAERRRLERERRRVEREEAYEDYEEEPEQGCCRYCSTGKPCGDSCIARNKTCRKGPGCAC
ncbi:formylglycine-generating enzyme family protein [Nannocystis pusilla]|uniref:formylglycine-generating enzyme family protein n=1 Tax=Nannocystis pusilla TaxID=889268 RepID=UPI003BF20991